MFIENILAASDSAQDITLLMSKLHDPLPHARALAYLVCRALLMRSSGDQQILLAHRFIHTMRLALFEASDGLSLEEVCPVLPISLGTRYSQYHKALDARYVGLKVTVKPGGRNTTHTLQASIVALVPALPVPRKFSAAWISVIPSVCSPCFTVRCSRSNPPKVDQIPSDPNQCYVSSMQEIYALASVSACAVPNQFSSSVLQVLFLNLRDNSLAFLLGALLSSSPSLERVRTHALLHVLAFIRGHSGVTAIDFQTVLPSLIAILSDVRCDKRDRALIFESISLLGSSFEKKHVFALDTIYGSASCVYLDLRVVFCSRIRDSSTTIR